MNDEITIALMPAGFEAVVNGKSEFQTWLESENPWYELHPQNKEAE